MGTGWPRPGRPLCPCHSAAGTRPPSSPQAQLGCATPLGPGSPSGWELPGGLPRPCLQSPGRLWPPGTELSSALRPRPASSLSPCISGPSLSLQRASSEMGVSGHVWLGRPGTRRRHQVWPCLSHRPQHRGSSITFDLGFHQDTERGQTCRRWVSPGSIYAPTPSVLPSGRRGPLLALRAAGWVAHTTRCPSQSGSSEPVQAHVRPCVPGPGLRCRLSGPPVLMASKEPSLTLGVRTCEF